MNRLLAIVLLVAVAACGDSSSTLTSTTTPTTAATTTTEAVTTTSPATTMAPATTVAPTTTTTSPPTTTTTVVSGEPYDFYVPQPEEGAVVAVIGVQFDDTLNVRSGPNISFDVIAGLDPTTRNITGTGNGWRLPSGSVWWEIEADGVTGWANSRFLSRLGGVFDLTSDVVASYGEIPTAGTMLDLALIVVDAIGSQEEELESTLAVVVGPTLGDLGEITIDIIGLADDSQQGWRAHVFGQPIADGFSLMSVEATLMCYRGVSDEICV